jgi:tetratricopeptide (TPR) repeat protein
VPKPPKDKLPIVDPRRFAVALARLEHDDNQEIERLVVDALRDVEGVQILRFNELISPEGSVPEVAEKAGHERARELLKASGAHILIWGTVLTLDARTAPRLFWTTSVSSMRSIRPYIPENFRLPDIFWDDLAALLRLAVVIQSAEVFARRGNYISKELAPFVSKVRQLIEGSEGRLGWTDQTRAEVMIICALGLEQLGEHLANTGHLVDAATYYRKLLQVWRFGESSLNWAATQNNLGVTLGVLGTLKSEPSYLEEAIKLFREVLEKSSKQNFSPYLIASVQSNLGNVLVKLGGRSPETSRLREALSVYGHALKIWTRGQSPLDWAALQNNIGVASQLLGERGERRSLEAAITAHRYALEEWTRDRVPMFWAQAQSNLGNALNALAERESGIELFQEAVDAYERALGERALETDPLGWTETQNNLGNAFLAMGARLGDVEQLERAVAALREAQKVRTRERSEMAWASTQNNLGMALFRLGEHTNERHHMEEAKVALDQVVKVWTRGATPSLWATARNNLGDVLVGMGRQEINNELLEAAVVTYREALQERDREEQPFPWAATQSGLGYGLYLLGERDGETKRLSECVQYYRAALEVFDRSRTPFDWAGAIFKLGDALRLLGQRKKDVGLILQALEKHASACRAMLSDTPFWAFMAARGASEDLAALTSNFYASAYRESAAQHQWVFDLLAKHDGHKITVMPAFKVIESGKSGDKEPDWKLAAKKGDRIKDGSMTWENAGNRSYCINCKYSLSPD